jgi:hypothetical protein
LKDIWGIQYFFRPDTDFAAAKTCYCILNRYIRKLALLLPPSFFLF